MFLSTKRLYGTKDIYIFLNEKEITGLHSRFPDS